VSAALEWRDEWVPLPKVIRHGPLQVRQKLDPRAVKRYADMTRAGSVPPPIKVGRVRGHLYLLDGWHRMEAGALQVQSGLDGEMVRATVAHMSRQEATWEAAKANLGHGVQYRSRELHEVFKAFIKAKRHVKPDGSTMSYREIGPVIGKPHTTIRTWMLKYFPKLAADMGGVEHGNKDADAPSVSIENEHEAAVLQALRDVSQRLALLTPEARWELVRDLEAAREAALKMGVTQPRPENF
jgi:hypothetical protein